MGETGEAESSIYGYIQENSYITCLPNNHLATWWRQGATKNLRVRRPIDTRVEEARLPSRAREHTYMPARVLVVYGSETGNVRRGIHRCVKTWQSSAAHGSAFTVDAADVLSGNAAVKEFMMASETRRSPTSTLANIRAQYDVIIIATSSFGEGDPPANFLNFLVTLVDAAGSGDMPLAGMQHAVVGYGQSVYPTFQNTPRYADKLLEALGSRRFVRRVELDEGPDETIAAGADPDQVTAQHCAGDGLRSAHWIGNRAHSIAHGAHSIAHAAHAVGMQPSGCGMCMRGSRVALLRGSRAFGLPLTMLSSAALVPRAQDSSFSAMGSGPGRIMKSTRGRNVGLESFATAVEDAMRHASTTAQKAPVCSWKEPAATLLEKSSEARARPIHTRPCAHTWPGPRPTPPTRWLPAHKFPDPALPPSTLAPIQPCPQSTLGHVHRSFCMRGQRPSPAPATVFPSGRWAQSRQRSQRW